MTSQFRADKARLQAMACPTCAGSGECDDSSPHDISYSTWTCPDCKGSGYEGGKIDCSDAAIAIGEEAFRAGYEAATSPSKAERREGWFHAWCEYEPSEEIRGLMW